jgi:hypothetical protein
MYVCLCACACVCALVVCLLSVGVVCRVLCTGLDSRDSAVTVSGIMIARMSDACALVHILPSRLMQMPDGMHVWTSLLCAHD